MRSAPRTATSLTLYVVCLSAHWIITAAWSQEGHKKIAKVANELLLKSPRRSDDRTTIHSLFGGDLVDFVGFEENELMKTEITRAANWHRQTPDWTCNDGIGINGKLDCDASSVDPHSLLCATSYTFSQYTHDGLLDDFTPQKDPLFKGSDTAKSMQDWDKYLHQATGLEETKRELRLLQALVGNIHQPLRWLSKYNYGHDVTVTFRGVEHTLLSLWEDYIPEQIKMKSSTDRSIERGAARYGNFDNKFREWAKDASKNACDIYRVVGDSTRLELTEEQFEKWTKVATKSIEDAGNHLAVLLYVILEHRTSKEQELHGRGYRHDHAPLMQGFMYNLLIAIVVVPSLLFALTWHEREGSRIMLASKVKS